MDKDAEKLQLDNEMKQIEQYLSHPISKRWITDNQQQQNALVNIICEMPIVDIKSFFDHFQAVGHLRGLRRAKALIDENLEEIKEQIKEL